MKILKSDYKFYKSSFRSKLEEFPVEFIDVSPESHNLNDESTIVFAVDFGAFSPQDMANWSLFLQRSYVNELDIKPLSNYHSFTHWVRMWWD